MEAPPLDTSLYKPALVVLGAAGVVIPLFHRLRVSPVLGFMLVGIVVGPFGLVSLAPRLPLVSAITISDPGSIEPIADLGLQALALRSPDAIDVRFERLSVRTMPGDDFIITHIARKGAGHGMTDQAAKRGSYVACVHLEKLDSYDIWCDGEQQTPRAIEAGAMHINDMRQSWQADIRSAFDVVNFCVPQSAFDEITSEEGSAPISELHCPINLARADIVTVPDDDFGSVRMQGVVPRFAATPGEVRHAGRSLGADNRAIYGDRIGLDAAELARLTAAGVI